MRLFVALVLTTMALSACANKGLREIRSNSTGPDEFIVDPKAELTLPGDLSALPTPTPGAGNRTDIDPQKELIVSLGGRPASETAPVPASDGALVTAASRYGVTQNIRGTLAAEDAEFRRRKSRFTQYRLFPEDRYNEAYSDLTLDARSTADAWRRAGASTPSYPPRQ